MKRGWWIAAALCAAISTGCGRGGGGGTTTAANPAPQTNASARGTAQFIIKIPPKPASQSSSRSPQYVSAATQSIAISIDGATPTVANLTPTSPNCSTSGSPAYTTCSVTASVLAGTHSFTLTTYDQLAAVGNKLSTTTLTGQTVTAGVANSFPLTLSGVVAGIVLTLAQPAPPTGVSATIPLTVAAQDADGYTILDAANSPYVDVNGNPLTITLSSSDTSGATLITPTSVTNSGTNVTVLYSGALIASAVISATASGVSPSKITNATLTPASSVSSGGAVAIAVVTIGATTYAFVPASNGLAQVTVASSGIIQSLKRGTQSARGARSAPAPPAGLTQQQLESWWTAYLANKGANSVPVPNTSASPGATPSPIPISPAPNECASTTTTSGATLYCIRYKDSSGKIDVVTVNSSGFASLQQQFPTDASGVISYSGGECYICGIVADTADNAVIISTKNGYELYSLASPYSHIKTIQASISENFGYDTATNQIWSPQYSGAGSSGCGYSSTNCSLDLINVSSSNLYSFVYASPSPGPTLSPGASPTPSPLPVVLEEPDQGSVDPTTGIAVAPEENYPNPFCCVNGKSYIPLYLMSLPNAQFGHPSPGPTGSGYFPGQQYFTDSAFAQVPILNDLPGATYQISDVAVDAPDHLAFFLAEFSLPGGIGVAQLPTGATATPALGDYVFANLPTMPNASSFEGPGDPHAVATATIGTKTYALAFDYSMSYVVVIDLKALLLAPRSATDTHLVASSYNLQTNGVIYYVAIPGGGYGGD